MPDFEMPYFIDGGGNKGYFKDTTAREEIGDLTETGLTGDSVAEQFGNTLSLLNGKVDNINLGEVAASTDIEALGAAWDTLNIYDKTVVGHFARYGKFEALMYKYGGSQYGMVIAMKYASTDIYVLSVRSGTKYYATYSSESGTVTSTLFDTNRIAVTSQNIKYQKSGNIVTVYGDVTFGAKVITSGNYINAGRLPFISSIQSIVSGKIVCDTGTTTIYEAASKGGTNSIWFSYNGVNEMQTTYFENKTFHLYLSYIVS